jgi:hypothetical protein
MVKPCLLLVLSTALAVVGCASQAQFLDSKQAIQCRLP